MPTTPISPGQVAQASPAFTQMHVLWLTAGLGCDGDSIAITAATQPSIEDLVLGAIPGLPKVELHHPVLSYKNGDDFLEDWHARGQGRAGAVPARRRRLDPEREEQGGGLLGGHGDR